MSTRVLLVEDYPADAYVIRRHLGIGGRGTGEHHIGEHEAANGFGLEDVARLTDGLERLNDEEFQVLVLDPGLPDRQGLETLFRVHRAASGVAIIVLSVNDDEELAVQAVRRGAQDGEATRDLAQLIEQADQAMYRKRDGKKKAAH